MAQLERPQRQMDTSPKTPAAIHTMEQLLRVRTAGEASKSKQSPTLSSCSSTSSSPSSPFFQRLRHHDSEEDHGQGQKKSVLTKVKEKAKKLRHSLSKKKHEDGNASSPSSATGLEPDGAEDEAEYLGPPGNQINIIPILSNKFVSPSHLKLFNVSVYESEKATVKGNARHNPSPRANPVTPEKHFISTSDKHMVEHDLEKTLNRSMSKKKTTQPATLTITPTTQSATAAATTTTQPEKITITPSATPANTIAVTYTNTNTKANNINNTNAKANANTLYVPSKTMTYNENVPRKLTPVHIEAPDEDQSMTSKVQNLTVSDSKPTEQHHEQTASSSSAAAVVTPKATRNTSLSYAAPSTAPAKAPSQGSSTSPRTFAPSPPVSPSAHASAKVPSQASSSLPRTFATSPTVTPPVTPTAPASVTTPPSGKNTSPTAQIWDKGVSVKEYLMTKLEPGEDEKALSRVISEAMSPRRTPGDAGVMEKVREAVTSLLRTEGSPKYADTSNSTTPTNATTPRMSSQFPASTTSNTSPHASSQMPSSANVTRAASQMPASSTNISRTSSQIPVSTNAQPADYEVAQEESHGRILQAN
ncbi:hypothetical protein Fmac_022205 [Flemingia macrophylla]|uniref:LTI65/LTI78 PGEED repeat domain-containing protein n=1 Tax=Flemingia macrophylla TaxID=520843 RepID=A0ABD1LZ24_9FABA